MSLLEKAINIVEHIDGLNGVAQALIKLKDADDPTEVAAAASQFVAELALAGAITATVRTSMSMVRLGLAISGQIWKWEALSYAAGAAGSITAGQVIDAANEWGLGARIYDWTHVDPLVNTNFTAARNWFPRRDPLTLDLDNDGLETVGINSNA
ncbi:MAG: hypothetical protein ACREBU_08990, partial [Nitrososphaera sp.]